MLTLILGLLGGTMLPKREFIPYATNVAIGPDKGYCVNCHIPKSTSNGNLCNLCWEMLQAISTPYFHALSREEKVTRDRLLNLNVEDSDDHSSI